MTKTERETSKAKDLLEGKRIVEVRAMTHKEQEALGWYSGSMVLIFDDGSRAYATSAQGSSACLTVESKDETSKIGIIY